MVWRRWQVSGPAGEAPLQLDISWIHPRVEELVREADKNPVNGSWLYRVERDGGHWPVEWVEFDIARMPTKAEATALQISTNLPVREFGRQGNSGTDGMPVEVTQGVVPADRVMTVRVLQRDGLAAEPWSEDLAPRPNRLPRA
jgi:GntR family transcriptional regulator